MPCLCGGGRIKYLFLGAKTIPRSPEDPKIPGINDAEVVGDGIAESGAFFGDINSAGSWVSP